MNVECRLKSFTPWEGPVDAHSMSEAGFVYTGQEDLVYCFSCNIQLDGWTKQMDPLLRHKEESPTCSFVRQQLQGVKSVVAPSNPQIMSNIVQSNCCHQPELPLPNKRREDDCSGPVMRINYQSEVERIRTFVGWPLEHLVHAEQLARVGFVYTGEGSLVQCFQCAVRYHNWLKGDIPLNVHQRCNPDCEFLQTLRSKQSSNQIALLNHVVYQFNGSGELNVRSKIYLDNSFRAFYRLKSSIVNNSYVSELEVRYCHVPNPQYFSLIVVLE